MPVADVVTLVPPSISKVPDDVTALVDPLSEVRPMLVTVPEYWSVLLIVTVDPVAEVDTFVPPSKVRVPELVIAFVDPLSLSAVILVTVPDTDLSN